MAGIIGERSKDDAFPTGESSAEPSIVPGAENLLICTGCGIEMTLLGKIPHNWKHRQIVVYRCFSCNEVISSED